MLATRRDRGSAADGSIPTARCARTGELLEHPVFHEYRSETQMLRYLRRLADLDLALDRTMIPLGSCTMKLNATTEMVPITWPEFGAIHPFAPLDQTAGYRQLFTRPRATGCARSPATPRCRSSRTPGPRASWPASSRSARTTATGVTSTATCA